jgi:hypothetical protein
MDDLVSMLPIMLSALETIEVTERRALVRSFIEFVKETSEQLNKYASRSTSGEYGLPCCQMRLNSWRSIPVGELVQLEERPG